MEFRPDEFYPISYLAKRLSRTTQTIRKWEKAGVIPIAIFRYGNKRMYHKQQVELICKLAKECDIDSKDAEKLKVFSIAVSSGLSILNKTLIKECEEYDNDE